MTLKRDVVISELRLLAAGANGGEVEPDDCDFPNLQTCLSPSAFATFARAVEYRYFTTEEDGTEQTFGLFELRYIDKWIDYQTLADAILTERKRLDVVRMADAAGKSTGPSRT